MPQTYDVEVTDELQIEILLTKNWKLFPVLFFLYIENQMIKDF